MKYILTFIWSCFVFFSTLHAFNSLDICIAHGNDLKDIEFKVHEHSVSVFKDNALLASVSKGNIIHVYFDGSWKVKVPSGVFTVSKNLEIKKNEWSASVKVLQSNVTSLKNRVYGDQLVFQKQGASLRMLNKVLVDHYVAGVVEAESGAQQNLEYYKVQSVICRTYALANWRRHEQEGFHLCDKVHCQVYKGKARYNGQIQKATQLTSGLVLADQENKLVNTSFHSNCGGQTANSEDVWTYGLSHLKSICDPFCSVEPHASWKKSIAIEKWLDYFKDTYGMQVDKDPGLKEKILHYLPEGRGTFFLSDDTIKMKHLRDHWKLPSAFFSYHTQADSVIITGQGFGHGVGLCQEGAMRMSELNYSYDKILAFYYQNVKIIPLKQAILPPPKYK